MRKSFIATLVLGALVIASCQKENDYAPKAESPVFTASFDTEAPADPDTKTQLVEDANGVKKSYWVSGDAIRVINGEGDGDVRAKYTTTENGASATFKKTTTESFTGTEFMALYPASPAGSAIWQKAYPEYIKCLWLTGTQSPKADSYDPQAHLAYARAVNNTFSFSNMVALLKFTVAETSKEVSSISVTVPAGEYVAGNFNFKVKDGENPMAFYKDAGGNEHLSTASLTGTFEAGKSYYLAVLPGTYSSLTLSVNGKEYKTKATESTFKANSIYNMGTVNVEEEKEIVMTIDKQNNWENVYIYAWDSADNKIFGAWPGTKVEGNTVTFPKSYYKAEVNYILNDGVSLLQTVDLKATLSDNFSVDLPADISGRFIVCNCPDWGKNLYIFNNGDTSITLGDWPGASLIQHKDYAYKYCDISAFIDKDFNFVLNDGYHKTKDLWTYEGDGWVKKDGCHYYKYDSSHKVQ